MTNKKMKIEMYEEYKKLEGADALQRLMERCFERQGDSRRPVIDFLISLYDGYSWRPDMTRLCMRIDDDDFADVIKVMHLFRRTRMETHNFFIEGWKLIDQLKKWSWPLIYDPREEI